MTVTTIVPTNVRDRVSHDANDVVLTGDADTMWGDGSDSTSAYRASSEPANAIILADVAPVALSGEISFTTAAMRVLLDSGNSDQRVDFWIGSLGTETPPIDFTFPYAAYSGADATGTDPTATPGVVTTLTDVVLMSNATGLPMTSAELTGLFASGFTLGVARRPVSGTAALTVYELTFAVDYTPAVTTRPPQLRKYPNPFIGPTRHYPRPRRGITGIR